MTDKAQETPEDIAFYTIEKWYPITGPKSHLTQSDFTTLRGEIAAAIQAERDRHAADSKAKRITTLTEAAKAICPLCARGVPTVTDGDTYHVAADTIRSDKPCRAAKIIQMMILDEVAEQEAANG